MNKGMRRNSIMHVQRSGRILNACKFQRGRLVVILRLVILSHAMSPVAALSEVIGGGANSGKLLWKMTIFNRVPP